MCCIVFILIRFYMCVTVEIEHQITYFFLILPKGCYLLSLFVAFTEYF